MQPLPDNKYETILSDGMHWFNTEVEIWINDNTSVIYGGEKIISAERERPGMPEDNPSIGGALASTLKLSVIVEENIEFPPMAKIAVRFQACRNNVDEHGSVVIGGIISNPDMSMTSAGRLRFSGGTTVTDDIIYLSAGTTSVETSDFVAGGTYFIDTREYSTVGNERCLNVTAFDSMMKAEDDFPDSTLSWPAADISVVQKIAATIGVAVDSRTSGFMTAHWPVDLPIEPNMRELLEKIAAMNCGNFVITPENKLLFVPLYGLDPEQNLVGSYLEDEGNSDALTFGNEGWYILV